jgi:uncharacterized protein (DUF433 family)
MNRITVDPKQMNGAPCIRGLRIPVATVVGMVAGGMTVEEIVREFPDLEPEDVRAALVYRYPLSGMKIDYEKPLRVVAKGEWEAAT